MNDLSPSSDQRQLLLTRSLKICQTATKMRCVHDDCARAIGKKNQALFTIIIIANAATAFVLASGLREMIPRMVGVVAAVLSAMGAACTGIALSFDYKGKAARHSNWQRATQLCHFHVNRTPIASKNGELILTCLTQSLDAISLY